MTKYNDFRNTIRYDTIIFNNDTIEITCLIRYDTIMFDSDMIFGFITPSKSIMAGSTNILLHSEYSEVVKQILKSCCN